MKAKGGRKTPSEGCSNGGAGLDWMGVSTFISLN